MIHECQPDITVEFSYKWLDGYGAVKHRDALSGGIFSNVLTPKLSGQKSGCGAHKRPSDYICDKMPVSNQQRGCPYAKQNDENGQRTGLEPDQGDCERCGHDHVARWKAAVLVALEEIEYVGRRPLEKIKWILATEETF